MEIKKIKKYFLLLKPNFILLLIFLLYMIEISLTTSLLIEEQVKINDESLLLSNIRIGTNNQTFDLLLDTGSYITWVPKNGSTDQYKIKNHYFPSKSITSSSTEIPFIQKFSTGNSSGYFYIDNVKYISNSNFKLKFGVAEKTSFKSSGADGIIGLAHSYEDESYSFIHTLKENKIIDSEMFSFKFTEDILIGNTAKFILGKHNDFSSTKTVTCPLIKYSGIQNKFWACEMSSFALKFYDYQKEIKGKHDIIFDTGSDVIILPKSFFDHYSLPEYSGCSIFINRDKTYRYSCPYEDRFDFLLTINGNTFFLSKDLFFKKEIIYDYDYPTSTTYYSKIVFFEDKCILGMPFFSVFHTLFDKDNEKIHFYSEKDGYIQKYKEIKENKEPIDYIKIMEIVILIIIFVAIIICICVKVRKARREQKKGLFNNLLKK